MSAARTAFQIEIGGRMRKLELERAENPLHFVARLDGETIEMDATLLKPGVLSITIAGHAYRCVLEDTADGAAVHVAGERFEYEMQDPRSLKARRSHGDAAEGPKPIKAPMPGRVVRILVKPGADVEANQGIVVIEAMKMQNELKAPKAGKVREIRVEPGTAVRVGEVLAVIE
jgi:biotin carboxyl carrier protein